MVTRRGRVSRPQTEEVRLAQSSNGVDKTTYARRSQSQRPRTDATPGAPAGKGQHPLMHPGPQDNHRDRHPESLRTGWGVW